MISPPAGMDERRGSRGKLALLLLVGLVLLRGIYLGWINLFPEEAYYWNFAQHLDIGYLDHPPMVAWLIALGTTAFGQTEFGVRFFAVVCSLATSYFAFQLAGLWYGRRAAAMAALLVQLLPFFFMTGWIMTPDAPLTVCWAGTLYFLARAFFDEPMTSHSWVGVGLWLGLGLLSKYTIALLGPAALLFLALDPSARAWFRLPAPYAAVLLALLIFSPVIYWNAVHHWASFAFQSTRRLAEEREFSLPALLGSALLMLTPVGVWLACRIWRRTDTLTDGVERRRWLFTWLFTLVPFAVFVTFSLTHHVKLNWTGPLWLALIPALAAQLEAAAAALSTYLLVGWRATVAVLLLAYFVLLQYLSIGLPGCGYYANIRLLPVGWPVMARELESLQAEVQRQTSGRVLIVGLDRDFIASEAAFYHSHSVQAVKNVTGTHLFDGGSLMYAYWFPPAEQEGASLVLASFEKDRLNFAHVRRHCGSLENIQSHTITVQGKMVCTYYTRIAHDYRSSLLPK